MTTSTFSFPEDSLHLLSEARLLAARLERLSADSSWSHRSSGLRGSLLRQIDCYEQNLALLNETAAIDFENFLFYGFQMLASAAREIRTIETSR